MFAWDQKNKRDIAKWLIGIVSACIIIYLAVRYFGFVLALANKLLDIVFPLILGLAAALILNVPMAFVESNLCPKQKNKVFLRVRRVFAIIFSFVLVAGIFTGIAILVIPELVQALRVLFTNIISVVDYFYKNDAEGIITATPFYRFVSSLDINWLEIKKELETWLRGFSTQVMSSAINTVSTLAGGVINAVIGFVFSIYVLYNKEKLKAAGERVFYAWLPKKGAEITLHILDICSSTFKKFISGQFTEAVILGSLCSIGMFILEIPYAGMIGTLVGVTALIPIVGAFLGTAIGAFMIVTVSPFKAVVFVIFLLILQQIEGNLIYPRVVGATLNLPAMWVLAAVTVGGNIGGPLGMFLGVPAASAAYQLLKEWTLYKERVKALENKEAHKEIVQQDTIENNNSADQVQNQPKEELNDVNE